MEKHVFLIGFFIVKNSVFSAFEHPAPGSKARVNSYFYILLNGSAHAADPFLAGGSAPRTPRVGSWAPWGCLVPGTYVFLLVYKYDVAASRLLSVSAGGCPPPHPAGPGPVAPLGS